MNPFRWFRERQERKEAAREARFNDFFRAIEQREELRAKEVAATAKYEAETKTKPTAFSSPVNHPENPIEPSGPDLGTVVLGAALVNELLGSQPEPPVPSNGGIYIPASAPCDPAPVTDPDATGFSGPACDVPAPDYSVGSGGESGGAGGGADYSSSSYDSGGGFDSGSSGGFDSGS